jgi:hypothetical protein
VALRRLSGVRFRPPTPASASSPPDS